MIKMELAANEKENERTPCIRVSVRGRGFLHRIQAGLLQERQNHGSAHCSLHVLPCIVYLDQ